MCVLGDSGDGHGGSCHRGRAGGRRGGWPIRPRAHGSGTGARVAALRRRGGGPDAARHHRGGCSCTWRISAIVPDGGDGTIDTTAFAERLRTPEYYEAPEGDYFHYVLNRILSWASRLSQADGGDLHVDLRVLSEGSGRAILEPDDDGDPTHVLILYERPQPPDTHPDQTAGPSHRRDGR